jgi:hypothetical protein
MQTRDAQRREFWREIERMNIAPMTGFSNQNCADIYTPKIVFDGIGLKPTCCAFKCVCVNYTPWSAVPDGQSASGRLGNAAGAAQPVTKHTCIRPQNRRMHVAYLALVQTTSAVCSIYDIGRRAEVESAGALHSRPSPLKNIRRAESVARRITERYGERSRTRSVVAAQLAVGVDVAATANTSLFLIGFSPVHR